MTEKLSKVPNRRHLFMGLQNLGVNGVAYHNNQRNQCCLDFVLWPNGWSNVKKIANPYPQKEGQVIKEQKWWISILKAFNFKNIKKMQCDTTFTYHIMKSFQKHDYPVTGGVKWVSQSLYTGGKVNWPQHSLQYK